MATSDLLANAAADAGSAPEANSTVAPGVLAAMALSGDDGNQTCSFHLVAPRPGGSTCAEPPPEIMPVLAFGPMTAMERSLAGSSGNIPRSFLNSPMLCAPM